MDALVAEHPELKSLPADQLAFLAGLLEFEDDVWVLDINAGEGP